MSEQMMSEQITSTDALDQALLALDEGAMVLEELDGFVAGLLVSPQAIPPGEWFARAMGLSRARRSPFADLDHANRVLGLVMDYHNAVALTLAREPEQYQPLFSVDPSNGDVIWELWIDGFAAAADLRPEAWSQFVDAGGEVSRAMTDLVLLTDIAMEEHESGPCDADKVPPDPMAMIRRAVPILYAHRVAIEPPGGDFALHPNPFASFGKVGRNEPCPCGSGKKFKRCCGAN
ncbi:hypothetical protein SSBR45G_09510 [Bradyrhizobium sp. SSBR45G]|uniref:UPF0149 family protein n=1 Tax=unclassified Bradyrhizobium TaxID=2631580 RepID=UPI002342AD5F|nr:MULTISPECIES: UPF0149 family protein [unclassified Bradyrhizobium]GLH76043.1 hypothetical protein SSBR45G_09510 [Bradyrhizobium sp. SSBR45G]GLH89182.1 hypothetical protein SSBR45R_66430 [Bradyrhizobium sp. SSBR45R]